MSCPEKISTNLFPGFNYNCQLFLLNSYEQKKQLTDKGHNIIDKYRIKKNYIKKIINKLKVGKNIRGIANYDQVL